MEHRLLGWLAESGISQAALGEALGIGEAAISRKLRGHRRITVDEARAVLAWASGCMGRPVTWDELFGADDVEPEATEAQP
jgi:transcriptional regulator with XRE-family HTH domain